MSRKPTPTPAKSAAAKPRSSTAQMEMVMRAMATLTAELTTLGQTMQDNPPVATQAQAPSAPRKHTRKTKAAAPKRTYRARTPRAPISATAAA